MHFEWQLVRKVLYKCSPLPILSACFSIYRCCCFSCVARYQAACTTAVINLLQISVWAVVHVGWFGSCGLLRAITIIWTNCCCLHCRVQANGAVLLPETFVRHPGCVMVSFMFGLPAIHCVIKPWAVSEAGDWNRALDSTSELWLGWVYIYRNLIPCLSHIKMKILDDKIWTVLKIN